MKERSYTLKYFRFYTITLSFKDKGTFNDKDSKYPIKFRYFAKLFQEPRETYFNRFCKDQELGLINHNVLVIPLLRKKT